MNNKGFTLVELLATLVILGIVTGIVIATVNINVGETKKKAEDVFVKTLTDAMDIYIDSDARTLSYNLISNCTFNKTTGSGKQLYKTSVTFNNIINSEYTPLQEVDMVNPANESKCSLNALVDIYRDSDYVYYYRVSKNSFNCLTRTGNITNLPMDKLTGCNL